MHYSPPVRSPLMHSPRRAQIILPPQSVTIPSGFPRRVTIENLCKEVLLEIFRHYLDASPRFWPRLAHTCRKWRLIVFTFQRALHLRLFCTHGTPVFKTLDCGPALPIVVEYGGFPALDPPAPEDEDNILAALQLSNRVSSICLTVTSSLLEKLSVIKGPFSELEELVLLSGDSMRLTLANTFRWGPHLRSLHLTRISFPSLPQLLYSSKNLVDLQLHDVFGTWHLSPDALPNALSGMAQLQSLSLHFLSRANPIVVPSPSGKRIVLSALTRLDYRGITAYLEGLVARIDAPGLKDLEITFFIKSTSDVSNLSEFIDRIEMQKSHRRADIVSCERAVSISLTQPGAPTCIKLQLLCEPLSRRLYSMAEVCNRFSAFLLHVEDLRINATGPPKGQGDVGIGRWRRLIDSFTGVKWFYIAGNLSTTTNMVLALRPLDGCSAIVLPALHKLSIRVPVLSYAPLREAVTSLVVSCWLSDHFIGVEDERTWIDKPRGTGPFSHHVAIEMLPGDVLLNLFRHYLHASPQCWPTLTHVCRRWRQIVLGSPLGLHLQLYCTHGTHPLKTLDCWPLLPIVIEYGGFPALDPPVLEDEDNILAALKWSNRVSSISLTVTSSLLEKLSTIKEPFSELEELVLLSQNKMQLTLPNTFQWGSRLRSLHFTRIAFPSFPRLLLPSRDIVDLQLHEIPRVGYFSPEAFVNALSGMTQLRKLSLHFLSLPPRRHYLSLPPPSGERVVLPALTCLRYRGTSKYLDSLVARIDAPGLGDIDITFFSQPTLDASQLGQFVDRIEILRPTDRAYIRISEHTISICFTQSRAPVRLELRISCEQLDWKLHYMAQICDRFSQLLSRIEDLSIETTIPSTGQDDVDREQWQALIRSFAGAKNFRVVGELATNVLRTLHPAGGGITTALPTPRDIDAAYWSDEDAPPTPRDFDAEWPMAMYGTHATHYLCHICKATFNQEQDLKEHQAGHCEDKHAHQIRCPQCGSFTCSSHHNPSLFREHLERDYAEVPHTDTLTHPLTLPHSSSRQQYLTPYRSGSPGTPRCVSPTPPNVDWASLPPPETPRAEHFTTPPKMMPLTHKLSLRTDPSIQYRYPFEPNCFVGNTSSAPSADAPFANFR